MADKAQNQKFRTQHFRGKGNKNYQHHGKFNEAKERRKKKIMHDFNKLKRKKQPEGIDVQKLYAEMSDSDEATQSTSKQTQSPEKKFAKKQVSRFSRAQWEHQKRAEKKQLKHEETERKKKEKEAALEHYRMKKKQKFLKLCKRTPKGQPVMKYQMQFLVDKLEQEYKQTKQTSQSS